MLNISSALISIALCQAGQLILDDLHAQFLTAQYLGEPGYQIHYFLVFFLDLFTLHAGEALQAHFQNSLGLDFRQLELTDKPFLGGIGVFRASYQGNHLIQVIQGYQVALQYVGAFLGLAFFILGTPYHYFVTVLHIMMDNILQVEGLRPAFDQRHIIYPERGLKLGVFVQVVEDNIGDGILFQIIHNAHTVAVAFIADVRNTLQLLFINQGSGLLNHRSFVYLVRYFGYDDLLLTRFGGFEVRFGTHYYASAAGSIGGFYSTIAVNGTPGREIRGRNVLHEFFHRNITVVDIRFDAVYYFGKVMGWHIGSHSHSYTGGTIEQQIWKLGR